MTPTSKFSLKTGKWEPYEAPVPRPGLTVISDLPEYISPLSEPGKKPVVIDGRAQRREELRRNNLREVDPSEWRGSDGP